VTRSIGRAVGIVVAAATAIAATTGVAAASSASMERHDHGCGWDYVATTYTADPGEVNKLAVVGVPQDGFALDGTCVGGNFGIPDTAVVAFSDAGAGAIRVGLGCNRVRPRVAVCGQEPLKIALGDRDDYLALNVLPEYSITGLLSAVVSTIDAGTGNDSLRTLNGTTDLVDCGAGADAVTADAFDELSNCETVTRVG
jgi:hypothetical protein